MKRWICLFTVIVLVLSCPVYAQESELAHVLEGFMAEHGLNEQNFSLSYYNTVTGEAYAFNDEKFMVAASTFKLPLNMYYYEMEQAGEIEPDAVLPQVGVSLDKAHEMSMVHSNNDVSIGMLYSLGDGRFATYKTLMRKYFTMTDEEIDYIYYADNYYCTRMMMDALRYLYENKENFSQLIGYMKQAQQSEYFCAGVTDYEVAHKYGWFEGAVNDVGIIYTDQPFLLAVYTQGVWESVVADAAALVTAYNVEHREQEPEGMTLEVIMVPKPEEAQELPPEPEVLPVEGPETEETEEPNSHLPWISAAGLVLLGTVLLICKKRKKVAVSCEL